MQGFAKPIGSSEQVIGAVGNDDPIIRFGHGCPCEHAVGDIVEKTACLGARIVHLADVMQPHVPFVVAATEYMGVSTDRIVAFQHQNPLAAVFGQKSGRSQSPHTRPDDDDIALAYGWMLLV